jgi:hypothetical protein
VNDRDEGFLSRWSRRKAQGRAGIEVEPAAPATSDVLPSTLPSSSAPVTAPVETPAAAPGGAGTPPPLPTMDDVAALTRESDYARFVMPGVDDGVKSAAMKKLFSDPHFNVMDGLDTYIDDYNKPDPIPLAMLRKMNQSKFLRLFDDEEQRSGEPDDNPQIEPMQEPAQVLPHDAAPDPTADDHDADLQLQPDDEPGCPGPGEGTGA